ncbi:MAG: hypothetical protein E6J20_18365 [Chloroflexi bacterium]|nr:MAG: hypothetical protein E6J20_18365 [Chloroflexota bacterium]
MSVQLVIRDGNPYWYLSPDIWVVPGADPNSSPGAPIAGKPAYLWAHVANSGNTDAAGVRIDFYWANPALQVTRSNATLVGVAYADVPGGGGQDVLCLVPWMPAIVNGGHECLVAVAIHPNDPLPSPVPDPFDPPTYRQVAQKNLSVLVATTQAATLMLTVSGLSRREEAVSIATELGGELDAQTLARLGLPKLRPARAATIEVGLDQVQRCVGEHDPIGKPKLELRVPHGSAAAVQVAVRAKNLAEGEYQLVRVVERQGDTVLGGLALVVISDRKERTS